MKNTLDKKELIFIQFSLKISGAKERRMANLNVK
jgi:hypothetical protein